MHFREAITPDAVPSEKDRMFASAENSGLYQTMPNPSMRVCHLLILLLTTAPLPTCTVPNRSADPLSVVWTNISAEFGMPSAIEVFHGEDRDAPLQAWVVRVETQAPGLDVRVVSADDDDGRESVSDMVRNADACLGVNGGYFLEGRAGFEHIGLLIAEGRLLNPATPGVYVDGLRYPVRRAALGFDVTNIPKIGWASSASDSSTWWSEPIDNLPGLPGEAITARVNDEWKAHDAVAAGPLLVKDGLTRITLEEEVFFHTSLPEAHPRTAAGIDTSGRLLLMVVDGRQSASRGVTLEELANMLVEFDASSALNLDGGGSSTIVISGELINKPSGSNYQREVVSGIVVSCL